MVYKLVSIHNTPRIKLSEEMEKTTLPGSKIVLRVNVEGSTSPLCDILCLEDEADNLIAA